MYPFLRNHYAIGKSKQEFYLFPEYEEGIKKSIAQRYSLIWFMYTCLFEQSLDGTPAVRDLLFDYPDDPNLINLKGSFLWGKYVKVTVNIDISKPNNGTFDAYFPKAKWYSYEGHS